MSAPELWTPESAARFLLTCARTADTYADRVAASRVVEYPKTGSLREFEPGGRFYRELRKVKP